MQLVYRVRAYDQLPQRTFKDLDLGITEMRIGHSDREPILINKRRIYKQGMRSGDPIYHRTKTHMQIQPTDKQ